MTPSCISGTFISIICFAGSIRHSLQFSTMPSTNNAIDLRNSPWTPLHILRETQDPSSICTSTSNSPRLAKDVPYANAVLQAWKDESKMWPTNNCDSEKNMSVGAPFTYRRKEDGAIFNGYLVAPSRVVNSAQAHAVPAVILFHTGAGPQDIFLKWKADALVQELQCAVLIADIISDGEGYAWSDRGRYEVARKDILTAYEENGEVARWKLRQTISAALNFLRGVEFIDGNNIAGLGWCMGGHPILELGLMQEDSVKVLVSYHGVFDGVKDHLEKVGKDAKQTDSPTRVLIFNGEEDPFVPQNDVNMANKILESQGCDVNIMNFDSVRHGFTNPAQDYNPSDAFSYDEDAANSSWESTINLLRETLT